MEHVAKIKSNAVEWAAKASAALKAAETAKGDRQRAEISRAKSYIRMTEAAVKYLRDFHNIRLQLMRAA